MYALHSFARASPWPKPRQAEEYAVSRGMAVVGVYAANERVDAHAPAHVPMPLSSCCALNTHCECAPSPVCPPCPKPRQAEEYASSRGMAVVGVYTANERVDAPELAAGTKRVADCVAKHCSPACCLLLDPKVMQQLLGTGTGGQAGGAGESESKSATPVEAHQAFKLYTCDSARVWRFQKPAVAGGSTSAATMRVRPATVAGILRSYLEEGRQWRLCDFEEHLDDVSRGKHPPFPPFDNHTTTPLVPLAVSPQRHRGAAIFQGSRVAIVTAAAAQAAMSGATAAPSRVFSYIFSGKRSHVFGGLFAIGLLSYVPWYYMTAGKKQLSHSDYMAMQEKERMRKQRFSTAPVHDDTPAAAPSQASSQ
ncbi:unnamed protein product [Closterium sp. Naga37s-1]|nr:unnamed protein product [Closterium sp. Naga37s-1]